MRIHAYIDRATVVSVRSVRCGGGEREIKANDEERTAIACQRTTHGVFGAVLRRLGGSMRPDRTRRGRYRLRPAERLPRNRRPIGVVTVSSLAAASLTIGGDDTGKTHAFLVVAIGAIAASFASIAIPGRSNAN